MRDRIYQILQDRPHTVAEIAAILGKPPRSVRTCLAEMVAERSAVRMQGPGPVYRADVFPPRPKEIRMRPMPPAAQARVLLASGPMSGPQLKAMLGLDNTRFRRLIMQEVHAGRMICIPKPPPLAPLYGLPGGA